MTNQQWQDEPTQPTQIPMGGDTPTPEEVAWAVTVLTPVLSLSGWDGKRIGGALDTLRKAQGKEAKQLAREASEAFPISEGQLSRLQRGEIQSPDPRQVRALVLALDVAGEDAGGAVLEREAADRELNDELNRLLNALENARKFREVLPPSLYAVLADFQTVTRWWQRVHSF